VGGSWVVGRGSWVVKRVTTRSTPTRDTTQTSPPPSLTTSASETCSLEQHLGDLPTQLAEYPLAETVVAREKSVEDINANWKVLVENFMEYYHLPAVHPELCTVSGVEEHVRTQGEGKVCLRRVAPLS
jgi:hypothetical protein